VFIKVLDVVSEISLFAGDFLRTKFLHEFWPSFQKTVLREKQVIPAHALPSAHTHTFDRFSAGFRVQARMLEVTTQLCGSFSVPRESLLGILKRCFLFRLFLHIFILCTLLYWILLYTELQSLGLRPTQMLYLFYFRLFLLFTKILRARSCTF
jgi:hypothetical protein